jgi:hypothetical protein
MASLAGLAKLLRKQIASARAPLARISTRQLRDVLRASEPARSCRRPERAPDAEGQLARHQRLGELDLRVVHVVAVLVADREHVAEALGHDERRRQALPLDQRVGDDRGGMDHHAVDRIGCDAGLAQHGIDAPEEAFQQVVMRGQRLVDAEAAPESRSTMSVKVPPISTASE